MRAITARRSRGTESVPNGVHDATAGGEDAEDRFRAGIDDDAIVDEHLELAVAPMDHGDVLGELAPEPRRHPGGVQAGESVGAVADGDPCHEDLGGWSRT